ncbi:hypothetical protein RDI58_024556 [Solanum bulbocastanum]|uniref:Uncharacterized protein n=1 Tax=Solanum bulbocastanum TaxID=147425 RepID=A0AAN8Y5R3_SOLBU
MALKLDRFTLRPGYGNSLSIGNSTLNRNWPGTICKGTLIHWLQGNNWIGFSNSL